MFLLQGSIWYHKTEHKSFQLSLLHDPAPAKPKGPCSPLKASVQHQTLGKDLRQATGDGGFENQYFMSDHIHTLIKGVFLYLTFTITHLAVAFIQRDLQVRQLRYQCFAQGQFTRREKEPGIEPVIRGQPALWYFVSYFQKLF